MERSIFVWIILLVSLGDNISYPKYSGNSSFRESSFEASSNPDMPRKAIYFEVMSTILVILELFFPEM